MRISVRVMGRGLLQLGEFHLLFLLSEQQDDPHLMSALNGAGPINFRSVQITQSTVLLQ
jgi:hypothetical protein